MFQWPNLKFLVLLRWTRAKAWTYLMPMNCCVSNIDSYEGLERRQWPQRWGEEKTIACGEIGSSKIDDQRAINSCEAAWTVDNNNLTTELASLGLEMTQIETFVNSSKNQTIWIRYCLKIVTKKWMIGKIIEKGKWIAMKIKDNYWGRSSELKTWLRMSPWITKTINYFIGTTEEIESYFVKYIWLCTVYYKVMPMNYL